MKPNRACNGLVAVALSAALVTPLSAKPDWDDDNGKHQGGRGDFVLSVIHSNDGESRLIDAGGAQTQYGGVARFASVVRALRAQSTDRQHCREADQARPGTTAVVSLRELPTGRKYPDVRVSLRDQNRRWDGRTGAAYRQG